MLFTTKILYFQKFLNTFVTKQYVRKQRRTKEILELFKQNCKQILSLVCTYNSSDKPIECLQYGVPNSKTCRNILDRNAASYSVYLKKNLDIRALKKF